MMRVLTTIAPWGLVGTVLIPPWLKSMEPADNWFKVTSITVSDADEGQPITMNVSRAISRPFVGEWVATVRRVDDGGVVVFCTAYGQSAYRQDALLPRPVTLDWWTHPMKCALPPDRYRLDTVWLYDVGSGVTKSVTADSNVFTIR